jgi:hypothetical protein
MGCAPLNLKGRGTSRAGMTFFVPWGISADGGKPWQLREPRQLREPLMGKSGDGRERS